ncbi:JmjC domain-containing protein [Fusarium sp. Ph1]|nr:JmjC domain-containing protein [Fusarium sp. Ph1]
MGLCEELEILKCGFDIHGDWSGLADKFPGRDPETIRHIYDGMKPTGNYCFTIEAQKGSSNDLNCIYRGLLTCCHPANRLIAELWMSYLGCQSDSQRTWWPKGVRYIKDKDSSLTQNELITLLPHMLGMVTRQDSIAREAGLTLPKLKALTLKEIQGTGPFPAPISAALHPALDLVFQLAEWEINSEAQASVAFSETLRVQCGRHSRFRRQLQKCFRSSGKFEQYKANPQHPLRGSLNVWMKQHLDGRSESRIVQFIEKMRAHFKAAYDNDEDSTVTSSIHIKDEQDCQAFILSKFELCQRWLLSCLASLWIRVLKPVIRNVEKAPSWWIEGATSRHKETLCQFLLGVFLLVLKQDPIADAIQLSLDALVDSVFLVFTTKGADQTILLRLEAVYQVAKRVDGLWGQAERPDEMVQGVRVKILDHVAIIVDDVNDADDVDDADDADGGKIVDIELVTVAFNIVLRRDRNSISRTFMTALFILHNMPISYQGEKPFFWPEGLTWSNHWYSSNPGLYLGVARSIEEHARLNKLEALEERVRVKLAKLAPPAKSAFGKIFVRAKERAAEIASSKTQRQDRIASTPLPAASSSASLIRSDTAQRERASQRRDGSPQPKRCRRASDDEGSETLGRKKQRTQGAERMARRAVQGVQKFLEDLKEDDDPWEVARMARNMLESVIRS